MLWNGREMYSQLYCMVLNGIVLLFSTNLKNVYAFGLSVCPSACACSNTCNYSSVVLTFTHAIHIWYRIDCSKKHMYRTKGSSAVAHKNFPIHFGLWGRFLKCILMQLYCTKYNKINISFRYTKACFLCKMV